MNDTNTMKQAIHYLETHLAENDAIQEAAGKCYTSVYHFSRVFALLCGCTIGEYIRRRCLTLAGEDLVKTGEKVIDIAAKYGYESPDSFAKSFQRFHGVTPTAARRGAPLRGFPSLTLPQAPEDLGDLDYRIEEKPPMILTGYTRRFAGLPFGPDREWQEAQLFETTMGKQWFLRGISRSNDTYCVISNMTETGYDFSLTYQLAPLGTGTPLRPCGHRRGLRGRPGPDGASLAPDHVHDSVHH